MRISDWSSDVCSSDLAGIRVGLTEALAEIDAPADLRIDGPVEIDRPLVERDQIAVGITGHAVGERRLDLRRQQRQAVRRIVAAVMIIVDREAQPVRSEEHTSELQSLMRISYAVFCLKKKKTT